MDFRPLIRSLVFAALFVHPVLHAQSSFTIVSAASYQPTLAPDSLASMFGANLAASAVSATLDANGQLPTQLGGIDVEVDGQLSALIYVSPLQINFLVPGGTTAGTSTVVVRTTSTGATRSATMQVQNAAPAVFTADASGKGPAQSSTRSRTPPLPFWSKRRPTAGTTSALGFPSMRLDCGTRATPSHDATVTNVSDSVQAAGLDVSGNRYSFVVEYAGAAPGYFGLDQVNIVLPPELDGAGVISLTITAEGRSSNIVSFQMGTLSSDAIHLSSLTLSKSAIVAGDSVVATISLNAPARAIGFPVSLRASNPAVQIPLSLTIPAGSASAQVSLTTSTVTTVQMVTITAQGSGGTQTATLEDRPSEHLAVGDLPSHPVQRSGRPGSLRDGHIERRACGRRCCGSNLERHQRG